MIEYLSGKIQHKRLTSVILNVNGVGYGLELPLSHLEKVEEVGSELSLWVYTRVREDNLSLYGFLTEADRIVFQILISCSGVGPKVAVALLSTMNAAQLKQVVLSKKIEMFEAVPGIGKRTAEKMQLELYGKLNKFPHLGSSDEEDFPLQSAKENQGSGKNLSASLKNDLVSVLSNLGVKEREINSVLTQLTKDYQGEDFSVLTKKALALVTSSPQKAQRKKESTAKKVDLNTLF